MWMYRLFQSTPAIAGGRIPGYRSWPPWGVTFQSTPAIAGGRILREQADILERYAFQSTPAIAGGRIPDKEVGHVQLQHVSIHARHCWRANLFGVAIATTPPVFQSTPAIAGGRIPVIEWAHQHYKQFQSTPAIAGGRIPTSYRPRWP